MCSMIVEKKLMQKHPTGIMIPTNMHADKTCVYVQYMYLVLAPKLQHTVIINKAYFDTTF